MSNTSRQNDGDQLLVIDTPCTVYRCSMIYVASLQIYFIRLGLRSIPVKIGLPGISVLHILFGGFVGGSAIGPVHFLMTQLVRCTAVRHRHIHQLGHQNLTNLV